jgi:hypothetical protein
MNDAKSDNKKLEGIPFKKNDIPSEKRLISTQYEEM